MAKKFPAPANPKMAQMFTGKASKPGQTMKQFGKGHGLAPSNGKGLKDTANLGKRKKVPTIIEQS